MSGNEVKFVFDTGGRKAKTEARDCGPRAFAIALGLDYYKGLRELNEINRQLRKSQTKSCQQGTPYKIFEKAIAKRGWKRVVLESPQLISEVIAAYGQRCVIKGRAHYIAVVDYTVRDTWRSHLTRAFRNSTGEFFAPRERMVHSVWIPSN